MLWGRGGSEGYELITFAECVSLERRWDMGLHCHDCRLARHPIGGRPVVELGMEEGGD